MTTTSSRAFPAPSFHAGDEPLRLPRSTRRDDVRIDAGRQLRLGLWLVLVISIGFGATLAARPTLVEDGARDATQVVTRPGPVAVHRAGDRLAMIDLR